MAQLRILSLVVAGLILATANTGASQTPPTPPASSRSGQPPAGPQQQTPAAPVRDETRAEDTRNRLRMLFSEYPPTVRWVLRLDPSLMRDPQYLANYPRLAGFLAQHPEVIHNPAYFVGESQIPQGAQSNGDPRIEAYQTLRQVAQNLIVLLALLTITIAITWLIRMVVEQRRWQRSSRLQSDLHNKLIDRFSSSAELLAYLQSPAGKGMIDMPASPAVSGRGMNAPLSRIFWSLQLGIVLLAGGIGLLYVGVPERSGMMSAVLSGVGIIVVMLGIGFALSAVVSFFVSQRLGLVRPLTTPSTNEGSSS